MKMMMMANMALNMIFLLIKPPMSMGTIIIMQTVLISMMTGMMYKSCWFSHILFLMYVGGMMVLFSYKTMLMLNMMFSFPISSMLMTLTLLLMLNKNKVNITNNDM